MDMSWLLQFFVTTAQQEAGVSWSFVRCLVLLHTVGGCSKKLSSPGKHWIFSVAASMMQILNPLLFHSYSPFDSTFEKISRMKC